MVSGEREILHDWSTTATKSVIWALVQTRAIQTAEPIYFLIKGPNSIHRLEGKSASLIESSTELGDSQDTEEEKDENHEGDGIS